jgi:type II secretory pathway pseudopilin PulG
VYYMKMVGQAENRVAGYAMAALLVAIAVMAVAMTVALPTWRQAVQREKEEELVFRGRQYVRAIQLYQRKFAATYPADVDVLVKQKFLRKKYKDPMVEDGEFEMLYQGSLVSLMPGQGRGGLQQSQGGFTFDSRSGAVTQGSQAPRTVGPRGGMMGVRSKSTDTSIRTYNGATHYNEWQFLFMPAMTGPGQGRPGTRGGPGGQGAPGVPGGRGGQNSGPRGGTFPNFPGPAGERGTGTRGGRGGQ